MVLFAKREVLNHQIVNRSKICKATFYGLLSLIVPVLIILLDPIHRIVNYNLRLSIGSMLSNILQNDIKGATLSLYVFNITNADKFLSGDDPKLKIEEVGPFVFQEYRWYEELEMGDDGVTMGMTPKYRSEFVPEQSIANPKDVNLTLLNLPLLSAASLLSNYDMITQSIFSTLTFHMKPIITVDVHSYLWGYKDPLISSVNVIAPSLVYFNSLGLFDRLYDNQSDYRFIVGATMKDRFDLKNVKKIRHMHSANIDNVEITEQNFTDTYEGTGYPPELTPDVPISLYRMGICRTFELEYKGSKTMEYGGEGFIYHLSKRNFQGSQNPITKEMYPEGLMDISSCYYGLPFVVSKPHFLDADPKLLNYVEGLKPDKELHSNEFVLDRRVGISFNTNAGLQLNMALDDIRYNRATRKLAHSIIPVVRITVDQPRMSDNIMLLFYLVYLVVPYCFLVINTILFITGLVCIAYAVKAMYGNWHVRNKRINIEVSRKKKILAETHSGVPLIINDERKVSCIVYE